MLLLAKVPETPAWQELRPVTCLHLWFGAEQRQLHKQEMLKTRIFAGKLWQDIMQDLPWILLCVTLNFFGKFQHHIWRSIFSINRILFVAKFYIYKCKLAQVKHYFQAVKREMSFMLRQYLQKTSIKTEIVLPFYDCIWIKCIYLHWPLTCFL